jgi:YaiO family outer membrane protein
VSSSKRTAVPTGRRHAACAALALALPLCAHAQDGSDDRWTFTPLYTYGDIHDQSDSWHEVELDLAYKASQRVVLGANVMHRDRGPFNDTLYTASISTYPIDALEWHASVTHTPDADFSPEQRFATGVEWRASRWVSLLLDYRHQEFAWGNARDWRPGAIVWFSDDDWLTARYTDGRGFGTDYDGYSVRYDHRFAGDQRLTLGYATGTDPEIDPTLMLPEAFLTEADYYSISYRFPMRPGTDLIMGLEYEDRSPYYERTAATIGISMKF